MNGGNSHPNMKTRMVLLLSHRLVSASRDPTGSALQKTLKEKDHTGLRQTRTARRTAWSVPTRQPISSAPNVKISGIVCLLSLAAQKGSNRRNFHRQTGGILPKMLACVK